VRRRGVQPGAQRLDDLVGQRGWREKFAQRDGERIVDEGGRQLGDRLLGK